MVYLKENLIKLHIVIIIVLQEYLTECVMEHVILFCEENNIMGCSDSRMNRTEEFECPMIEFMTLFEESDFEPRTFLKNRVEKAKKVASKLPGRFRAYNINEVHKEKLIIKGMPELYVLYIKLPKEKVWVSSETWEEEFLNVQMIETIHIWTELGASDIIFSSKRLSKNNDSIMGDIGAGLPGTKLILGGKYDSGNTEESDLSGHIKLQENTVNNYNNIDEFIKKNGLYYVKFAPEWINIISYKINNPEISNIDFQYTFTKGLHYNGKLSAKFDEIGVSFGMSTDEAHKTSVKYNIIFKVPKTST
jgi:hypothetical protein